VTMPGRRFERMANISATLPVHFLDTIDKLVDEDKVPSRSYLIREAVGNFLKEMERKSG
jgi:metal-responsive CopG/Arc/MetJ family transcriptional regulator